MAGTAGTSGSARRLGALRALWSALRRSRRAGDPGLRELLAAVPRLIAASARGRYTGLSGGRLALMGLALLYVVSPVDLVPEAVFLLAGLADDALVVTWLAGAVLEETSAFLSWERSEARTGPSEGRGPRGGEREREREGRPETVEGEVVV